MDAFLRSNNFVRLIAFVLSVMLWLVVRAGPDAADAPPQIDRVTETITGTVEVLLNKERVSLVGEPPEVTLKIHGERLSVWQAKMQANKLKFLVDARNYGEGIHQLPVQVQGLPPGVSQDSQYASIRLEANVRQVFRVELVAERLEDPTKLAAVRAEPNEVAVTGPASLVQQVQKVQARIPVQAFDAPGVEQTVVVNAVNDKGKTLNLSLEPKTVDLVYQPTIQRKEFPKLTAELKGLAKGLKAVLPPEGFTVTVEGLAADVEAIRPEDIKIVVDVTGLGPGDYVREAAISVPATVKLAEKAPLRVPVKITPE
ncbi:YbbR-like domain-containing protein [Effusibacillus consociatus]|uniref:YbbR-like domain-containing protein n=1 Tax=Effusibacillus consociatus TaxID=1117041 RepID=A0ABV9PWR1_9BACL